MRRSLLILLSMAPWSLASGLPHEGCFRAAARLHGIPADLLVAVAEVESSLDSGAVSGAGAHGMMQIQWPGTARHLGVRTPAELYNPCRNIELGARYLAELMARYGDERRALAAYNYGPTRIDASPVLPGGATDYVERVQRARKRLESPSGGLARRPLVFRSARRAERFAAAVNRQLSRPAALVRPTEHGARVEIDPGLPLQAADLNVLTSAGLIEDNAP